MNKQKLGVGIYSAPNLEEIDQPHTDEVIGLLALTTGNILSWSKENTICLWDIQGNIIATLKGHESFIANVRELSDRRILSWDKGGVAKLWKSDGTPITTLESAIDFFHELSTGSLLLWNNHTHELRLYDPANNSYLQLSGHTGDVINAREMADGRILSCSRDKTIRIWKPDGINIATLAAHRFVVIDAIEMTNGHILSWSWQDMICLWDSDGQLLKVVEDDIRGQSIGIRGLSNSFFVGWFDPHDRDYTQLRLWNSDGNLIRMLEGHTETVLGVLELSNGNILSWSFDQTLIMWDIQGNLLRVLKGHSAPIESAIELSNGRILSWAGIRNNIGKDALLRIWDIQGNLLNVLEGHRVGIRGAVELHNGWLLSWGDDRSLCLWDNLGNLLATFFTDALISQIVETDNGNIVVGDEVGRVQFLRYGITPIK